MRSTFGLVTSPTEAAVVQTAAAAAAALKGTVYFTLRHRHRLHYHHGGRRRRCLSTHLVTSYGSHKSVEGRLEALASAFSSSSLAASWYRTLESSASQHTAQSYPLLPSLPQMLEPFWMRLSNTNSSPLLVGASETTRYHVGASIQSIAVAAGWKYVRRTLRVGRAIVTTAVLANLPLAIRHGCLPLLPLFLLLLLSLRMGQTTTTAAVTAVAAAAAAVEVTALKDIRLVSTRCTS